MKKIILLIIIIFNITKLNAQCSGITFTSQQDVDDFSINNPNCTEINGFLTIYGNDITNLDSLNNVTNINGDFDISNVSISILSLPNLLTIGGNFHIENLNNLTSFNLNNLSTISDQFAIVGNTASLHNINGLNNLQNVGGLLLSGLEVLTNLNGFTNLTNVTGGVGIDGCNSLENLIGLDNITNLNQGIFIKNNNNLLSFDGLENITEINGNGLIWIEGNAILNDINGIKNIDGNTISSFIDDDGDETPGLIIINNPLLSNCAIESICTYLSVSSNSSMINNNLTNCNTRIEIENQCSTNSINENKLLGFSVYPTLTESILNIKSKTEISETKIYSKLGQLIIKTTDNKIDISNLTQGLYFVKVEDVNGNFGVKKILKK